MKPPSQRRRRQLELAGSVSVACDTTGTHTLRWLYRKDSTGTEGSDCAWVDCVVWTGTMPDANDWNEIEYVYDLSGRRIEKKVDGTTELKFLYDGDQIIAEYDANDTLLRKYVYGPCIDEPICMIESSGTYAGTQYYHYDALGSVVAMTDPNGDVVQLYEYSVYGQVAASDANHPNRFMFTGREFDKDTGLYYYRARYYNPEIGRFLQTDPIGYGDGMNPYRYCGNGPLKWRDPLGLFTVAFYYAEDTGYGAQYMEAANDHTFFFNMWEAGGEDIIDWMQRKLEEVKAKTRWECLEGIYFFDDGARTGEMGEQELTMYMGNVGLTYNMGEKNEEIESFMKRLGTMLTETLKVPAGCELNFRQDFVGSPMYVEEDGVRTLAGGWVLQKLADWTGYTVTGPAGSLAYATENDAYVEAYWDFWFPSTGSHTQAPDYYFIATYGDGTAAGLWMANPGGTPWQTDPGCSSDSPTVLDWGRPGWRR
jgi:RHS repeat-associated protein